MNQHKQQRVVGYGPIGGREFHDYTLLGRELQVTVKNYDEKTGKWEEETMLLGKLVPGIESKTSVRKACRPVGGLARNPAARFRAAKRRTRRQKRAKTGKPILVFKKVLKDRSRYHADGRRKVA